MDPNSRRFQKVASRVLTFLQDNGGSINVDWFLMKVKDTPDWSLEMTKQEVSEVVQYLIAQDILEHEPGRYSPALADGNTISDFIRRGILYKNDRGLVLLDDPDRPHFLKEYPAEQSRPRQTIIRDFIGEFPGLALDEAAEHLQGVLKADKKAIKNRGLRPMIEQEILILMGAPPVLYLTSQPSQPKRTP